MPFGFGRGRGRGGGGKGRGFRGGKGFGPGGPPAHCICPHCNMTVPHRPGLPCFQTQCPRCGSPMTREFFRGQ